MYLQFAAPRTVQNWQLDNGPSPVIGTRCLGHFLATGLFFADPYVLITLINNAVNHCAIRRSNVPSRTTSLSASHPNAVASRQFVSFLQAYQHDPHWHTNCSSYDVLIFIKESYRP